jgi:lactate permease
MSLALSSSLAALPIAALLFLMLALRWSAARAGVAAMLLTLLLALTVFGYGDAVYQDLGRAGAVAGALAEAAFAGFTILWILFPALAIYHLQKSTGAIDHLQRAIRRIAQDPPIIALMVAWFFALFLEGAAGFGTPVALAAPFLVSAGFKPVNAVSLALIGHAAGVSFGAVGTPVMPQVAATDFTALEIAQATGIYAALLAWLLPLAMVLLIRRGTEPSARGARTIWLWAALSAALFLLPYFAISRFVGPELPTLGGALTGGLAFVVIWSCASMWGGRRIEDQGAVGVGRVIRAGAPYLFVVALILITRVVAPIREGLGRVRWEWTLFERFDGGFQVLYHPGTVLLVSFLLGAAVQRAHIRVLVAALVTAARQVAPVSVALLAVLVLSRLMVHAGMIDVLAQGAAGATGPLWPLLVPLVGALGTFVTGSATSSNILFTDFQEAAARQTGMASLDALGGQGFGAAAGNMIAPLNLLAGGATVGLVGREGDILRRTLPICLAYAVLGGVLTWLLA